MKLQGKITDHSIGVASRLISETLWPKYLVYDVVMLLGIEHVDLEFPPLDRDHLSMESASTTRVKAGSAELRDFRRKCGIRSAADVFRHAMHRGACIVEWYLDDNLPAPLTRKNVSTEIRKIVGANVRHQEGLTNLP